jgi:hypothetical protein
MTAATQFESVGGQEPLLTNSWSSFDKLTMAASYPSLVFHQRTLGLPRASVIQRMVGFDAEPSTLVPATFERLLSVDDMNGGSLLAARGTCSILLRWETEDEALAIVSAATQHEAEHWMQVVAATHSKPRDASRPELRTWRLTDHGSPTSTLGCIDASPWAQTARNYPGDTAVELDALMQTSALGPGGARLILWFGAPGTGKTSAIRTLARQWNDWCDVHLMADPDAVVNRTNYLNAAVNYRPPDKDLRRRSRQRLIVAEDCDGLLTAPQRQVGPALSRLLNVTDGLSGQSAQAIMLITTNQPLHHVHPALVRPGRCLALIEFDSFNETEANDWLPDDAPKVHGRQTLAQLYEHTRQAPQIGVRHSKKLEGGYL